MSVIDEMSGFIARVDAASAPEAVLETLRMHIFDTIVASLAGSRTHEFDDVHRLFTADEHAEGVLNIGSAGDLPVAVLLACAAARCSEIDDIHLRSCVTPGSIVVPTALALASALPKVDDDTFLSACLAGYEATIRFGLAVNGPQLRDRGIWPSLFCIGFGVCATTARFLGLPVEAIANALAVTVAGTYGVNAYGVGRSARWFVFGHAAHAAILSTMAAARGLKGDTLLLDKKWTEATAVPFSSETLLGALSGQNSLQEVSFKPWCGAKQTIAATVALQQIMAENEITASQIRSILVEAPPAYAGMIGRAHHPSSRLESLSSIRYQLALAALEPAGLFDIDRQQLRDDASVKQFMQSVDVRSAASLEVHYPDAWPGRVTVNTLTGTKYQHEVLHAPGDPGTDFSWDKLEKKARQLFCVGLTGIDAVEASCRALGQKRGGLQSLVSAVSRTRRAISSPV